MIIEAVACSATGPPRTRLRLATKETRHAGHTRLGGAPELVADLRVYDAIVIGAGISGMYMLYRLRELGMTVRVFETGTNVGGTWYWNRYPGARFDSESWDLTAILLFKALMAEWDWKEHFSPQPGHAGIPELRRRQVRPTLGHGVPQHGRRGALG